jgi:hypothetical protein
MRRLTISTLRREWKHVYGMRSSYVPWIRLSGNWLAEAGFREGHKVRVHVGNGALRIETEISPPEPKQ